MSFATGMSRVLTRRRFAVLLLAAAAACAHKPGEEEDLEPRPDPILLHVKNENFLDMNIFVVVNNTSRRLGTVSGNGQADFNIEWQMIVGQTFSVVARPIGGQGAASTGSLNVSPDQMIEFRIGTSLRQSAVAVHERP